MTKYREALSPSPTVQHLGPSRDFGYSGYGFLAEDTIVALGRALRFKAIRQIALREIATLLITYNSTWVVVKIMAPFWGTLNIRCRIVFKDPKRDHNFDNHWDHPLMITQEPPC